MEIENEVVEPQVELEEQTETTEQEGSEDASKEDDARRQLTARAKRAEQKLKEAESERKSLEEQLQKMQKRSLAEGKGLDVEDYIDISSSLDGLDARQKAYLAEQHRLSGKPLKEIRQSEDFELWNEAYSSRLQKEVALKPSSTQGNEDVEKPFLTKLKGASLAEKEQMLTEAGLWRTPRHKSDRTDIGKKTAHY
jgi:hypothetical protein